MNLDTDRIFADGGPLAPPDVVPVLEARPAEDGDAAGLCSPDPSTRDRAWRVFYPRARSVTASRLRAHFGLKRGLDDQDIDDAVDAAIAILFRRCVCAPPDNPVRQPYALLVSISIHLVLRVWKRRKRERELSRRIALTGPTAHDPCVEAREVPASYAVGLAAWLLSRFDKGLDGMPREIKAGTIGALFGGQGLAALLDESLDQLPDARRRHSRLYHVDGLPTTRIARLCDCGPSNVSNNLRKSWVVMGSCPLVRRGLQMMAAGVAPTETTAVAGRVVS